MCLIITQPAGLTLSHAHIRDIAARNGDGFGIMRAHRGALHVWRTVGDVADIIELYTQHAAGRACVLHWRMATHGAVSLDNAHPFKLTRDIAVVHNGMLDVGTPTRGLSDTWHMAHHVLAPIARDNPDALFSGEMNAVLAGLIGSGNKLVFQHADGRTAIVNRAAGVEHRGAWYSNTYAWDAPAHLRPSRAVTRWSGYGSDTWFDEPEPSARASSATASSACASSACTSSALDVVDIEELTADGEPVAGLLRGVALDALADAFEDEGQQGIVRWLDQYPGTAAELLAEAYAITTDDAAHYCRTTPLDVAGWLEDALCTGTLPA